MGEGYARGEDTLTLERTIGEGYVSASSTQDDYAPTINNQSELHFKN